MADKRAKSSISAKRGPARAVVQQSAEKLPSGYSAFLEDLKDRIQAARVKAALSVNRELIALYWDIGKSIVERQRVEGWGKSIVDRLAEDIQRAFPGIEGFSPSNIWRMRAFYLAWTEEVLAQPAREFGAPANLAQPVRDLDGANLPQVVSTIPWSHNIIFIQKLKEPAARLWYARMVIEHGWSRPVLEHQIELRLYERQGKAVTKL